MKQKKKGPKINSVGGGGGEKWKAMSKKKTLLTKN